MWTKLKDLYERLKAAVNKLGIILLPKICDLLAQRRGFKLEIPGGGHGSIESVEPVMEILGTQEHPRSTFLVSKTGERVRYLLKGSEDLRLDERLMQFFVLVNSLVKSARADVHLSIATYTVVPLTKQTGLIKWVTGADTIHQMMADFRDFRGIPLYQEYDMSREFAGVEFRLLNGLQRYEIFEIVQQSCKATELFEMLWLWSPNARLWVRRTESFTVSVALMSMIGYIVGLGDRHPSNIMVQKDTGTVVHIDFGESFESALMRKTDPEQVPFRLTRLIVNALEGSMIDGLYERMCVTVMRLIRRHRVSLSAQLAIFIREPLDLTALRLGASETVVLDRVFRKLQGNELGDDDAVWTPEAQVAKLIRVASNPHNYIRHYHGWCPFW
jgi:phosphatidylinositol kinase/protein kinase (PI-3  family)